MHIETKKYYNLAKAALHKMDAIEIELQDRLDQEAKAEINLDSIREKITREYDSQKISKTALKDIVAGNAEVMKAKEEYINICKDVIKSKRKIEHLERYYNIEKKAMDAETQENKKYNPSFDSPPSNTPPRRA